MSIVAFVVWFVRHQQKLRLRAHLMQEAIRNRDFTFRMPTHGLLSGERAMQETLNQLGETIRQQVNQNEVESWERLTRVLTTTQPEEILKLMAQQPVDLVLLDMNFTLGVNNGNEGLFWLRTIRRQHPQTPVVLLTAYADVNLAVKGLKNGAADFITKPWDNDELVRKLKDVLDMQNEIISLDEMEKEHIRRTIDHCHGNLTQAAELLGITRQTLYNKMKRL